MGRKIIKYIGVHSILLIVMIMFLELTVSAAYVSMTDISQTVDLKAGALTIEYDTTKTGNGSAIYGSISSRTFVVTITATGTTGKFLSSGSDVSTTLRITNNASNEVGDITFEYSYSDKSGEFTLSPGESFSGDDNADFKVTGKGGASTINPFGSNPGTTSSRTITFKLSWAVTSTQSTFMPAVGGTVSYPDGTAGENGITYSPLNNGLIAYSAKPVDETWAFFGFKVEDKYYIANESLNGDEISSTSYPVVFPNDVTATPIFVKKDSAIFGTSSGYFPFLDEAIESEDTLIKVQHSGVAYASSILTELDNYASQTFEIPEGVTLWIPHSASDTGVLDETPGSSSYSGPRTTAYSTLTISENDTLDIKGTVLVNARQGVSGTYFQGNIYGTYGKLMLESGSVVNVYGKLYAFGIVDGSGEIKTTTDSYIYQFFEITDWCGGTNATNLAGILGSGSKVFPVSQFYIQNIRVKTTYVFGSTLRVVYFVSAGGEAPNEVIDLISDSDTTLFKLSSGQIVMECINDNGQSKTKVTVEGTMSIQKIALSVYGVSIDSSKYTAALSAAFDFVVGRGGEIKLSQGFNLLPGATLEIKDGGQLTIESSGKLYLYEVGYDYNNHVFGNYRRLPFTSGLFDKYSDTDSYYTQDNCSGSKIIVNGTLHVKSGGEVYTRGTSNNSPITTTSSTGKIIIESIWSATGTLQHANYNSSDALIVVDDGWFGDKYHIDISFSLAHIHLASCATCSGKGEPTDSCVWEAIPAVGTYYSNGSAWYTHADVYYDDDETTVLDTLYYVGEPASVTHPASAKDDGTYTYAGSWSEWAQGPEPSINYTTYNNYKVSYTKSGIVIYADAGRTDDGDVQVEYFLKDYIWLDLTCYVGDQITALGDVSVVLTINGKTYPAQIVNDGSAIYVVAQVTARQIPETFSFVFSYNGYDSSPISVRFETRVQREDWNGTLIEKMIEYGKAAKLYFDGEKYTDTLLTLNELGVADNRGSVANSLISQDTLSIRTTGVTGVFAERIAFTVHMGLKQGDAVVNPSVLFDTYGDKIVQIGLLVGDAADGELLLTSEGKYNAAYLLYSRGTPITGGSGLVTGLPESVTGSTNSTLTQDELSKLDEWKVTFDLATEEYAKQFSLRLFVVVETGAEQYKVLYGTQYHYGLSDYIARTYNASNGFAADGNGDMVNEDGCYLTSYKNFMAATWEYMNAAGETKWPEENE